MCVYIYVKYVLVYVYIYIYIIYTQIHVYIKTDKTEKKTVLKLIIYKKPIPNNRKLKPKIKAVFSLMYFSISTLNSCSLPLKK